MPTTTWRRSCAWIGSGCRRNPRRNRDGPAAERCRRVGCDRFTRRSFGGFGVADACPGRSEQLAGRVAHLDPRFRRKAAVLGDDFREMVQRNRRRDHADRAHVDEHRAGDDTDALSVRPRDERRLDRHARAVQRLLEIAAIRHAKRDRTDRRIDGPDGDAPPVPEHDVRQERRQVGLKRLQTPVVLFDRPLVRHDRMAQRPQDVVDVAQPVVEPCGNLRGGSLVRRAQLVLGLLQGSAKLHAEVSRERQRDEGDEREQPVTHRELLKALGKGSHAVRVASRRRQWRLEQLAFPQPVRGLWGIEPRSSSTSVGAARQ